MAGIVSECSTMAQWKEQRRNCKQTNNLYVVHFHEEFFPPSVALGARFAAIAVNYPNVYFLRVDVNGCKVATNKYGVKAFPEVHFFKHGKRISAIQKMTDPVPPPPAFEKERALKPDKVNDVEQQIALWSV